MSGLIEGLRRLFVRRAREPENVDELRREFRARYHSFKLLLGANQKVLELMADIERALEGRAPFGMAFVRSRCTSIAVNVYSMIQKLERLAPGRHTGLEERYATILRRIERILRGRRPGKDDRLVIGLEAIDKDLAGLVGSKMASLADLATHTDMLAPPGFVVTAHAYQRFIGHNDLRAEIGRRIQLVDLSDTAMLYRLSSEIQQLIIRSPIPEDLETAMRAAWQRLADNQEAPITVAMRSSAIGEDAAGISFAGQYRSELNVSRDNFLHTYKEILASKYSLPAITYRLNRGFRDEDIAMCVGCMVMVDAAAGGVVYTGSPVDPADQALFINAALGLPKSVVDGSASHDLFVVSRDDPPAIIRSAIQDKTHKYVCYPEEGVCRLDVTGEAGNLPSLDESQVLQLATAAREIEIFYGGPQDIEWAYSADGDLFILQCRSLVLAGTGDRHRAPAGPASDIAAPLMQGGITASAGTASGPVYLVDKGLDLLKFPENAVLVARQASPRWASLLNRAAAVVTEQGGFAGHLANVAREYRVPALFGLEGAVATLTPGKEITVDATGLAVYPGKVAQLLATREKRPNIMVGSPVYRALSAASRHMIPLYLLDPEAATFKPKHCRTFHDITRYIHEKSVQEMFRFGREHAFAERASKQLHFKVPMKWWVLNLDDGFKTEVSGKYVRLTDIACLPMLAFWEGFVAVSWEGPPVDGKGLMSVMFHSTANTALTPGRRTSLADRNYFIITKNYCNLNSRLGYHFALLEALVSDRRHENYVSFQFKGGATDEERRFRRVRFIGDLLTDYGFGLQINEDHLTARVEGEDRNYMLDRIKILGYLSLHTRQLDMIMSNPAKVQYYRRKLQTDIRQHILPA
jgi:pyruvate,water dikinase